MGGRGRRIPLGPEVLTAVKLKDCQVATTMSMHDREKVRLAAFRADMTVAEWVRLALVSQADYQLATHKSPAKPSDAPSGTPGAS